MTGQPQHHCDHECVCAILYIHKKTVCDFKGCSNDTRSRPAPSPQTAVDELTDAYRNGFVDGQTHAAKENERINTAIRNAMLEDIIKFRKEKSKDYKIHDMWVAEHEYLESLRTQEHP